MRNPLAAPEVIGVTSGAGVAALGMLLVVPGTSPSFVPATAFLGGIITFGLVYAAAWKHGLSPMRLALVGLAGTALFSAVINALVVGAGLRVAQALTWLAGSTYARDWSNVAQLVPWMAGLVPIGWWLSYRLDLLALGEDTPVSLGLPLERSRFVLLAVSVALASSAVAAVGTLSFVGLMAPHMARGLAGARHCHLFPVALLLGALLVVAADTLGRTLFAPREIPAGLVTAALGSPYFLYLLARSSKR